MKNQNFSYQEAPPIEKFKGVIQLLEESWKIYRSKIKTLLGIMVIPILFSIFIRVLIDFLSHYPIQYSIWFSIIRVITFLFSLFLGWLVIPSLIYEVKENIGMKESYKKGLKIFISFFWVFILLNLIILGGFLIFIIPGIIFTIWFGLAFYSSIFEEKRGMNALFKSQHLVSGKFWGVLRRLLSFGLIIGVIFVIILIPIFFLKIGRGETEITGEIIGYLLQLFLTPFPLIYGFLIYEDLEKIKKNVPYKEATLKRKLKYLLPGLPGLAIWIIIIGLSSLNIFLGRDIPPIDDSDLWLSKMEIPKEENALYCLIPHFHLGNLEMKEISKYWPEMPEEIERSEKIYWPTGREELIGEILTGEKWNEEFVKDLLKNKEQILNDFEKAVKSPYYQNPITQDPKTVWVATPLISLKDLRNIAKLNLIESTYLFRQGKQKEAFDKAIKTIKTGQLMEDAPRPTFIEYLVGMKLKEEGLKRLRNMIPETKLSLETLIDYINRLDKFKSNEPGLINVMKMEYIFSTNTKAKMDAAFSGKASPEELRVLGMEEIPIREGAIREINYLYKPNQTQRMFAELFRNNIRNVDKYYSQMELYEIKPLAPRLRIKAIFIENYFGKVLYDIMTVSYEGVLTKKCQEDFSVISTQLLLAIRAYQIENGKIPTSLDELLPKYISEIPKDPFDGKPIRFSAEKKIIYSVGSDLIDARGSEGKDWQRMPDPTFKIEF